MKPKCEKLRQSDTTGKLQCGATRMERLLSGK